MKSFGRSYSQYREEVASKVDLFGFDMDTVTPLAPALGFLFHDWWKVDLTGLEYLPKKGPALIVGNQGSFLPWPGLMLLYALMSQKSHPRRLSILADMDWIDDERLYNFLREIGFVSWSADNAKRLFAAGETVLVFPEGTAGAVKQFG